MSRTLCLSALLALSSAVALAGPVAYAPNGLFTTLPDQDDLIMFDVDDPEGFTVIGPMGVANIGFGGMDFDRDGNLYAYASFYRSTGGAASGLYRVNMSTGHATPIGASIQPLEDIAFNPVDNKMYGIRSQNNVTSLYRINLNNGNVTLVGTFTGLGAIQRTMSFAIDSAGAYYVHEMNDDRIYKGTGLALSLLYSLPQDTNYSQGMTIDWSRDDLGYHAAVGQGEYPNYFCQLNTFATDGSAYTLGSTFGPNIDPHDGFTYPPVEPGDVAIMPGVGGCNQADLAEPFGTLDFFDVQTFLAAFSAHDPEADLNDDGSFDFFDVQTFLQVFSAGCP